MHAKFDWKMISKEYAAGAVLTELQKRYGFAKSAFYKALKRGDVSRRLRKIERILAGSGESYNRTSLKKKLIENGVLKNECGKCGQQPIWQGKTLVMTLDHKNGIHNDDRFGNLWLLCPNCHSQTETFAGRREKYK